MRKLAPGLENLLKNSTIKTDPWGRLLLYKAVTHHRRSWYCYTNHCAYTDGALVCQSRNTCSTDRGEPCAPGLHAFPHFDDALFFASTMCIHTILLVAVDPKDVVCVPVAGSKIRCCKLYVYGEVWAARDRLVVRNGKVQIKQFR